VNVVPFISSIVLVGKSKEPFRHIDLSRTLSALLQHQLFAVSLAKSTTSI